VECLVGISIYFLLMVWFFVSFGIFAGAAVLALSGVMLSGAVTPGQGIDPRYCIWYGQTGGGLLDFGSVMMLVLPVILMAGGFLALLMGLRLLAVLRRVEQGDPLPSVIRAGTMVALLLVLWGAAENAITERIKKVETAAQVESGACLMSPDESADYLTGLLVAPGGVSLSLLALSGGLLMGVATLFYLRVGRPSLNHLEGWQRNQDSLKPRSRNEARETSPCVTCGWSTDVGCGMCL
jgi:hypothetical protein